MNLDLSRLIYRKIAIELPVHFDAAYPDVLKREWGANSCEEALEKAFASKADYVCVKFNIADSCKTPEDTQQALEGVSKFIDKNLKNAPKPLILRGANNSALDARLVPLLAQQAPCECIIAFADEFTYEQIVPECAKRGHTLVLRSPIDINLAKELNILSIDKGMPPDKILIDPDMGGLGYGLEYGYSIIEKIKQAARGTDMPAIELLNNAQDSGKASENIQETEKIAVNNAKKHAKGEKMLDMPVIAFIGEESYRAKEAKSDTFNSLWGEYEKRAAMWEITGASAMLCAGADIVVLWNPASVECLKGVLCS